jgi:putative Ig domain-containing protein
LVESAEIKRLTLILVVMTALATGADAPAGGISDEPCPNVAGENTNTCPPGKIGALYSLRFVEREGSGCGPGRQTFHFDSGELPSELTLAADGALSGIPTEAGTFKFYVEMREPQDDPAHCAGKRTQKQFTLSICDELGIVSSPAPPPRAEVGVGFQMTLRFCGGMGALAWTMPAGVLPAGVRLDADGTISGVPRRAGEYRFAVTATDALLRVATYVRTITVAPTLRVLTQRLPAASVGHTYRARLAAIGGVGPKVWRVKRGDLPRGLRLDPARGVLYGTPQLEGTRRMVVVVRDGLRVRATKTLSIVISDPHGREARGRRHP